MARKVYYGVCPAAAGGDNNDEYSVYINDLDITANSFNFNKGDLLVVFFAYKNSAAAPKLVIYINDSQFQPSIGSDSGKFIKTHDNVANCEGAWGNGETVIFAYTLAGNNTYYWELVNGVHSSTEIYGATKTFDDSDFDNWITTSIDLDDINSGESVAPRTLKKLYQLFAGDDEVPGLRWVPVSMVPNLQTLGTLSLGEGVGVNITYPLEDTIRGLLPTEITHTGQLINNGNGAGEGHETEASNPFITKYVPDDLYFNENSALYYKPAETAQDATPQRRIVWNNSNNEMTIGLYADNTLSKIVFGKPVRISGNTDVSGTLTTTGFIDAGSAEIKTTGNLRGGVIYENGKSLETKYSPRLKVVKFNHKPNGTGSIAANSNTGHQQVSIAQNGWTALGVVGYNANMMSGHNSSDALYSNIWECYLMDNKTHVEYSIFNMRNQAVYVQLDFYVLYQEVI